MVSLAVDMPNVTIRPTPCQWGTWHSSDGYLVMEDDDSGSIRWTKSQFRQRLTSFAQLRTNRKRVFASRMNENVNSPGQTVIQQRFGQVSSRMASVPRCCLVTGTE